MDLKRYFIRVIQLFWQTLELVTDGKETMVLRCSRPILVLYVALSIYRLP